MPPAPASAQAAKGILTACYPLCHFVNDAEPLGRGQGFEAEALYRLRLTGADPEEVGGYSSRRVISTTAARRTPKASKPVLICPDAMLNNVTAKVAAPISKGIARSPGV
jgi:hypothetical protein